MKLSHKFFSILFAITIFQISLNAFQPHFMKDPAISPEGETVCFGYLNDLWLVAAEGGTAQRLTATSGTVSNPEFSPNGQWLAYNSDKDNFNGIYLMPAIGGEASLISGEEFSFMDWFSDNQHILASKRNYQTGTEFYKLDLQGNYQLLTSWGGEFAKLSPDDKKIIFNVRGMPYREKYRGSVDGEIWEYDIAADQYLRLTDNDFTERYPLYSADGESIYFSAAVEDKFQVFSMSLNDLATRKQLTDFSTWSARDFSISDTGKIIYEYFDKLQILDSVTGKLQNLEIKIAQDLFSVPKIVEDVKNKADEFAISDDGKLLVFAYKYNLFAMPAQGGEVKQITFEPQVVNDIVILNDNKTVLYSGFSDQTFQLFKFDIRKPEKQKLVRWSKDKYISRLKRLDKQIAIMYSLPSRRGLLAVADSLAENIDEIAADEFIFIDPTIDKQGEYLAFVDRQQGIWSSRLFLYNLTTKSKEMLYYSNKAIYSIHFGLDNKSLLFTEDGDIKRMDLEARDDFYLEDDHWPEILQDEVVEAENPESLQLDRSGISERIETIVERQGWNYIRQVISDSTFYFTNNDDDKTTLWSSNYSGENQQKIFSFKGRVQDMAFNAKEDCFYFTVGDALHKLDLKKKKEQMVTNQFDYSYSEKKLNQMLFDRVWSEFGRGFYDVEMQGVDWAKLHDKYYPYLEQTTSLLQLSNIIDEMIGEVNASHTGFYPRREEQHSVFPVAALGLEFDFSKKSKRGLVVKKVYHNSKLAQPFEIKPGDLLLSIDGESVKSGISALLRNKVGEKLQLVFQTAEGEKEVEIKGLSSRQNYQLYYDNWVAEREKMVAELSDNRLGYLHIQSMNWSSYKKFEQDLFAKNYGKEALIIDVRNNGGGNIHDYLIETLTRQTYALNSHRNYDGSLYAGPANSWEKPMVLLINQDSFSDAEIFPNLFSELELGKVIGMPTSGSVIGTNHYRFRDGSSMRMPGHGWFTKDGTNMEGSGAQPDIFVEPTPSQIIADDDVQLKRAVQELLEELR